jgi:hypothetical protein
MTKTLFSGRHMPDGRRTRELLFCRSEEELSEDHQMVADTFVRVLIKNTHATTRQKEVDGNRRRTNPAETGQGRRNGEGY